ncbi:MAG: nucleotidyltransferase domain-containing protein [Candidatus Vecturithrix sp.]|jgi:predicted nucleotidyltransferase|nr:nucleotidyltransferase domain-containing protein [Candidatus Vecturithrix sp.]
MMVQEIVHASSYIPSIIERLRGLLPNRVILFGSYAYGEPHKDSDIDLIVVLDKHGIGKTYQEKRQNRLLVGKALLDIEREVPIDTRVYTLDEWNLFLQQNSAFAKLIREKGVTLHETDRSGEENYANIICELPGNDSGDEQSESGSLRSGGAAGNGDEIV